MTTSSNQSGSLKIFLSYSRKDLHFADQLQIALEAYDFEVSMDRKGIFGAEHWEKRLGQLILEADTVVFVLSPDSASSKVCHWEVDEALRVGKRIVPIVWRPLDDELPHTHLQDLNFIHFYQEPTVPGSGFGHGIAKLTQTLTTDLDWLREHTRLIEVATRWQAENQNEDLLVRGSELQKFLDWRTAKPTNAPRLTNLQRRFLQYSERIDTEQRNQERLRLDEIRKAQEEREVALQDAENAQLTAARLARREAEQSRKVVRRTVGGLIALLGITIVAVLLGVKSVYDARTINFTKKRLDDYIDAAASASRKIARNVFSRCIGRSIRISSSPENQSSQNTPTRRN